MNFVVDITPSGTMPNPETADEMATDVYVWLSSMGTTAPPAWIVSIDSVTVVNPGTS